MRQLPSRRSKVTSNVRGPVNRSLFTSALILARFRAVPFGRVSSWPTDSTSKSWMMPSAFGWKVTVASSAIAAVS
jgi:hypothetical protein